jgi:hypothetical protein
MYANPRYIILMKRAGSFIAAGIMKALIGPGE